MVCSRYYHFCCAVIAIRMLKRLISPATDISPTQKANNADSVSMSWRFRPKCVILSNMNGVVHHSPHVPWTLSFGFLSSFQFTHLTNPPMYQTKITQYTILYQNCAHFCYKMVHCGIWDRCIVEFKNYVNYIYKQQTDSNTKSGPFVRSICLGSYIAQCIRRKLHNTQFCIRIVHISVKNGALWDMGPVHCGICELCQLHI